MLKSSDATPSSSADATSSPANWSISDLSVAELMAHQATLESRKNALKADEAELAAEMDRRFGEAVQASLKTAGKTYGTLTEVIPGADGLRLKHYTRLDVRWDSDKLMAWASTQPWHIVSHYCDVTFKVKEAVFKAIEPGSDIQKAIAPARTEKIGKTTYEILPPK